MLGSNVSFIFDGHDVCGIFFLKVCTHRRALNSSVKGMVVFTKAVGQEKDHSDSMSVYTSGWALVSEVRKIRYVEGRNNFFPVASHG